ncbi:pyruvate dehydrogenase, putative [Metarhizium acridum CQMa 102]|uniref:Pyruvate dehydrogenase, putative n=1 Tax=Metarhizium acridum (strain CQMa 102) TaxID=655827 RepID=E9E6E4_METAQ|nr:pyruvate dehydrogenase, putative [Metarhizium acridum CQMa 102]EFY88548.1 pyruvate dehydrogenase, putative [Metarhizium acridum CQMa 102]
MAAGAPTQQNKFINRASGTVYLCSFGQWVVEPMGYYVGQVPRAAAGPQVAGGVWFGARVQEWCSVAGCLVLEAHLVIPQTSQVHIVKETLKDGLSKTTHDQVASGRREPRECNPPVVLRAHHHVSTHHKHPPHPRVSCLNTKAYSSSSQPPRDSPGTIAVTFGALIAGAYGFYFLSQSGPLHSVPSLVEPADEDHIPVRSPVEVHSLKAADAKTRQQATSFTFGGNNGNGRIDVVRVASNNPVEDEWAVAVGKGVGGSKTLYAGVYDGHANLDARTMNEAKYAAEGAATAEPGSAAVLAAIAPAVSGSCALLSMYDPTSSIVRTAVTGDSRAVLGSWSDEAGSYSAVALSKDQTGFNQDEVRRLDKAHPGEIGDMIDPKTGHLLGIAITRGFGDHRWPKTPWRHSRGASTASPVAPKCVSRWLAAQKAGKPETIIDARTVPTVGEDEWPSYKATPEFFAIEDLDNAAVRLVKKCIGRQPPHSVLWFRDRLQPRQPIHPR